MSYTVAAVVVTFNRKELLAECLGALYRQTRRVDRIVVVDNASSDGTREMLEDRDLLRDRQLDYVRLPMNLGGAGGYHEGMKAARSAGCDWIWLMDDDAEPHVEALARMEGYFNDPTVSGIANLQLDKAGEPQLLHRGWFRLCRFDGNLLQPIALPDTQGGPVAIDHASFVGLAVRASAIDAIGYPKKEFFLHYDDFEYCIRLSRIGRILLVPDSIITHKEARMADPGPSFMTRRRTTPAAKLWLTYFGTRNLVWVRRHYCGLGAALLTGSRKLVRTLLLDDKKSVRCRLEAVAVWDGLTGRFDNTRPRRLVERWIRQRRETPNTP